MEKKILYFDCFSGISGDMTIGALIDLGIDREKFQAELAKINIGDEFKIDIKPGIKKGISGTDFTVILNDHDHHGHHHAKEHVHKHEDHPHHHEHDHSHHHETAHAHHTLEVKSHDHHHAHSRNLNDIYQIIDASQLSGFVKDLSKKIFMEVAVAEAKIHAKTIDDVHFHEVGAVDSIVDIIGAAICIEMLEVDEIHCSEINVGSGFVKCEHGIFPVPAPATMEILRGMPIYCKNAQKELTTPTGAAILKAACTVVGVAPEFVIEKVGYGMGKRDMEIPNVLRAVLGLKKKVETLWMLETNIDNMNPEIYSVLFPKLLENQALDVFVTPIIMKKNRPANILSVLCHESEVENLQGLIFSETTTLGIRKYKVEREELQRSFKKVSTAYGEVTVKCAYKDGKLLKFAPEFEDCRRIAEQYHLPVMQVLAEINVLVADKI